MELAVAKLMAALGVDDGDHTEGTPRRVAKAWRDQLWGYGQDPAQHLAVTFTGPEAPGLIVQTGIDIQSICAHHMLPFGGHATVAYRPKPGQPIVGLSKLTRLTYAFAARLQVQERLGFQIVDTIWRVLTPQGAVCVITADHSCMRLRGVRSPSSLTTTVAQQGDITEDLPFVQQLHLRHA